MVKVGSDNILHTDGFKPLVKMMITVGLLCGSQQYLLSALRHHHLHLLALACNRLLAWLAASSRYHPPLPELDLREGEKVRGSREI
jgi:hypothetical protein